MRAYAPCLLLIILLCPGIFGCGRAQRKNGEAGYSSERAARIVELHLTGDWVAARVLVDSLGLSETDVNAAMRARNMPQSTRDIYSYLVFRLAALSRERTDPVEAALTANQISAMLIDLEEHEDRRTLATLDRLAYLGREVILLAEKPDDYGLMNTRLARLEQLWTELRPDIAEQNAEALAAQVDQVIADLRERGSPVRMANGGNRILDLVREMKVLYR